MDAQAPQPTQDEMFNLFWRAYPKRTNKGDARKAWEKLRPDAELVQAILIAIAWQRQTPQWAKDDGQYIPYPGSWIRGERWLDEPVDTAPPKSEHWRDECSRLHGGTCEHSSWHAVKKSQAS